MIPLAVPNLCGKEREYLNQCIDSTFVSTVGEFVNRFETLITKESSALGSVCVNSGTSALHLSLIGVGVEKDDLVILPNLTFIASANSIAYVGADPWLMDIDEKSWTLCPRLLEAELASKTEFKNNRLIHKESGRRVSCIMPVYTLGCPADMDEISRIAKKYELPIIVDAAAAIGAKYKGKEIGELGTIAALSFNGNKTITSGGGGAVVSCNKDLLDKIRHLSTTARVGTEYFHDQVGFNYRMTNLEAAVGCAQIENLKYFIKRKREIKLFYDKSFSSLAGVGSFPEPEWATSACWFSGIIMKDYSDSMISSLINELNENGVMARKFWLPISLQPCFANTFKSSTSYSDEIWNKIIVLPCSTGITSDELDKVVSVTKKAILNINE